MQSPPRSARRGLIAACATVLAAAGTAAAAAPAHAADGDRSCRASVVRASLLGGAPIEPLAANRDGAGCATDSVGLAGLGGSLPLGLGLDAAFATTTSGTTARARSGAAAVTLPGALSALRVEGVEAAVSARCAGTTPALAGDSTIVRIRVGGVDLPVDGVVERTGLAGLPARALLRLVPGEEIRTGGTLTRRALHVTLALGATPLADAVVGEATAGATCAGGGANGGGSGGGSGSGSGGGGGSPAGSGSSAGVHVLGLRALGGFGIPATHPCRNARYGGDRALVGTRGRDTIAGAGVAARLFGLQSGDRLTGGSARDCLEGGKGADRLKGAGAADLLLGSRGRDTLRGGAGADRLRGGRGGDRITLGRGRDRAWGGRGNDRITAAASGRQRINCGRGRDSVRLGPGDRQIHCERVRRIG